MPVCRECFNFKTQEQEQMKLKNEVSEVTLRSATEEVGEDGDDDASKLIVSNQKSSENKTDSNILMSAAAVSSSDQSKTFSSAA